MNEILRCLLPIPDLSDVCLYSPNWKRIFRGGVREREMRKSTFRAPPLPYELSRMILCMTFGECTFRGCMKSHQPRAIRLAMRRIMAAYTDAPRCTRSRSLAHPPVLVDPRQRTLHHPPPRQHQVALGRQQLARSAATPSSAHSAAPPSKHPLRGGQVRLDDFPCVVGKIRRVSSFSCVLE